MDDFNRLINGMGENIEGLETSGLRPDTALSSIPQWDSLAILTTIVLVDEQFGVEVKGKELVACKTLQDILDLVMRKRAGA